MNESRCVVRAHTSQVHCGGSHRPCHDFCTRHSHKSHDQKQLLQLQTEPRGSYAATLQKAEWRFHRKSNKLRSSTLNKKCACRVNVCILGDYSFKHVFVSIQTCTAALLCASCSMLEVSRKLICRHKLGSFVYISGLILTICSEIVFVLEITASAGTEGAILSIALRWE